MPPDKGPPDGEGRPRGPANVESGSPTTITHITASRSPNDRGTADCMAARRREGDNPRRDG